VLVGRVGQRAYLTDLLIGMGRRGSYLVTGRRGAGKTVFVNQCISEYRKSVFKRYLRSNVGKGMWDRLVVIGIWIVLLAGALVLSELSQLLSRAAVAHEEKKLLVWAFILPVGVLFLYPCAYAKEVFEAILKTGGARVGPSPEQRANRGTIERIGRSIVAVPAVLWRWVSNLAAEGIVAAISTIGIAYVVWFWGPFGAPAIGLGRMFLIVCGLYFLVQVGSVRPESVGGRWTWRLSALLAAGAAIGVLRQHSSLPPVNDLLVHLGGGLYLLGLGCLARSLHQRLRVIWSGEFARGGEDREQDHVREMLRKGAWSYRLSGWVLLLGSAGLYAHQADLAQGIGGFDLPGALGRLFDGSAADHLSLHYS